MPTPAASVSAGSITHSSATLTLAVANLDEDATVYLRYRATMLALEPLQTPDALGNDSRFERGVTVCRQVQIHRADLGQRQLRSGPGMVASRAVADRVTGVRQAR